MKMRRGREDHSVRDGRVDEELAHMCCANITY